MNAGAAVRAAGFGQRALAWNLDLLLLSPLLWWLAWPPVARALDASIAWLAQVQGWMLERVLATGATGSPLDLAQALLADPQQGALARAQVERMSSALLQAGAFALAITTLYFVAFEAGAAQATPGKRLLGLRVETATGARPSPGRALGRHLAGVASWATLNLGHLLVALRPDGRALHDLMAGTRVCASRDLPAWGRAALTLLAAAALLAPLVFAWRALGALAGV